MLSGARNLRVFAATKPTDMRKSFNTLFRLVEDELGRDPLSGELFLFTNSRRTRAKVLFWDGTGLVIYMKRIERGRFAAPWSRATEGVITLSSAELSLFLEGSPLVFLGNLSPQTIEPITVATNRLTVR